MKQTPLPPGHNPQEPRNLSDVQFKYTHPGAKGQRPDTHTLSAHNASGWIGHIDWNNRTGAISNIMTAHKMRGLGVATTLFDKANKLSADTGIKAPIHSSDRTDKGDLWAKSVGGDLPKRASYTGNEDE
jgi:hypothetical protein